MTMQFKQTRTADGASLLVRKSVDAPHYEVIESRRWINAVTGATASLYGSAPYVSESDKANWHIETVGYTIRDNKRGTIGIGRKPFATKEQAQEWINARLNA